VSNAQELGLEATLARLEEIVTGLEREDLELDEALKLFEEGIAHLRNAQAVLNTAELRIERLIENAAGVRTETVQGTGE
jgi:exodeoxyribonuclease VII small subunit